MRLALFSEVLQVQLMSVLSTFVYITLNQRTTLFLSINSSTCQILLPLKSMAKFSLTSMGAEAGTTIFILTSLIAYTGMQAIPLKLVRIAYMSEGYLCNKMLQCWDECLDVLNTYVQAEIKVCYLERRGFKAQLKNGSCSSVVAAIHQPSVLVQGREERRLLNQHHHFLLHLNSNSHPNSDLNLPCKIFGITA